jgi:hypothetical protein
VSGDWFPLHCCWNDPIKPPCEECAYCLANAEIERLRAGVADALAEALDWPEFTAAWQEARRD